MKPLRFGRMTDRRERGWLGALLPPLLVVALLATLLASPLRRNLDAPAFDLASVLLAPEPAEDVVIVAIDEPSFAEIGKQWPWPRSLHADLVRSLRAAGAKSIALDMVFAEPSSPDADAALARALGPDVLLGSDETVIETPQADQTIRVEPLQEFLVTGTRTGVVSVALDGDGALRRAPPYRNGFAAEAASVAAPLPGALVRFRGGPRSYRTVSYYQALKPAEFLPPDTFKGKTVFVGLSLQTAASASASQADAFATPFTATTGRLTSGVEAQATIFDAIRSGDLARPAPYLGEIAALLLAAAAGLGLSRGGRVSWKAVAAAVALALAIFGASLLALDLANFWLSPIAPALALLAVVGIDAALDYARERRARRDIEKAFGQYLAPEIVERLARDPSALKLGGERRTLTVLFADVRGFTTLAEAMKDDPERLTRLVNRLLGPLSEAVLAERGTIDKYIGDCVMAFWNAPLDAPDHAERAVAAGRKMLEAVERLNAELAAEAGDGGAALRLAIGVGINTGDCVVGNLGSEKRFDYTAVGDAVNLASRLEGASKLYGVPMLIGETTARALVGPVVELDRIAVKGKSDGVAVFTVLDGAAPGALEPFLAAYRVGRWDEAEAALAKLREEAPGLSGYVERMAARVLRFRETPPDADWRGVFTASEK
ncbi:adenylate/guanylate cyclase domain-containing protein [Methylopila sp. M107]|uniref:adenylate/guanylate cyclase domain-containing protein n=1 Tax=Methylopila sp. M107 TaxID=1101190 RepID=UPI00039D53CB|nr:adenylate/guanylate cyclase domain-containing protein [Methylopila sp. M107]